MNKGIIFIFILSLVIVNVCIGQSWDESEEIFIPYSPEELKMIEEYEREYGPSQWSGVAVIYTPEEREQARKEREQQDFQNNSQNTLSQRIQSQEKQSYQHMDIDQFYQLFSLGMSGKGYQMSVDNCKFLNQNIVGDYCECKVTENVYFDLFFDEDLIVTGLNITGYQKKAGDLCTDIDTAFRNAYFCFFSDTRETTYQEWLKNIQHGMEINKTYTVNGIGAIWGEGLMTGNISRNGQYYYKITFFCD